ncbi:hypothetical protein RhiirC2_793696 [Rhizophagus irregularis]|uniref:Uncharacterized protein n=1 Tax=Rhizophagus irregularis TaxID=588596 RepID=A0A2N1MEX6_9GLOM|nr:hypothetical protein RhiirC2_793696 [Rhizophagus irregularis]
MVILFDKLVKKCGVLFTPLVPHYYNNSNYLQGVHNHSPPPPERTANGIKDDLQTLNKKMNLNKIILSKRQSNLGKLLKATEILSDIHMSVNNIGRLRYLVGKMRIFIHLAKEYLGVIHCVQTKHDLKINS